MPFPRTFATESGPGRRRLAWALALLAGACGCAGEAPGEPAAANEAEGPGPAVPLLAPVRPPAAAGELPPGHPPLESGSGPLAWTAPAGWISEPPSSAMRRAQYRVPGPGGDAECVVYYFGPGQGGDTQANLERWAGQFRGPEGQDPEPEITELQVSGLRVTLIEVAGTYVNPLVLDAPRPGYRLLGAIAQAADANWFFKLTGPDATVQAQREAFAALVRSLRVAS